MPSDVTSRRCRIIITPQSSSDIIILDNIESGTQLLRQILIDENNIQFGKLYSSIYEANVWVPLGVELHVGDTVTVRYGDVVEVNSTIFTGELFSITPYDTVQSSVLSARLCSIVVYDHAYNTSKINVASWWNNAFTEGTSTVTRTISQLIYSLLSTYSVVSAYAWNTIPNANVEITKTQDIENISFSEMLSYLCQFCACIPYSHPRGTFYAWKFSDAPEVDFGTSDISEIFEMGRSEFQTLVPRITGIRCVDSANNTLAEYGTMDTVYTIVDNPIINMAARTEQNKTYILSQIYNELCSDNVWGQGTEYMYRLCDINMLESAPHTITLGSKIKCSKGTFFVFENTLSGPLLIEQNIRCLGDPTQNLEIYPYNYDNVMLGDLNTSVDDLNGSVGNISDSIETINDSIEDLNDTVDGITTTTIPGLDSRITTNANNISSLDTLVDVAYDLLRQLIALISTGDNYLQIGNKLFQWGEYTFQNADKVTNDYYTHSKTIQLPKAYDTIGTSTVADYQISITPVGNRVVTSTGYTYPRTAYFSYNAYNRTTSSFDVHAYIVASTGGTFSWFTVGTIPTEDENT